MKEPMKVIFIVGPDESDEAVVDALRYKEILAEKGGGHIGVFSVYDLCAGLQKTSYGYKRYLFGIFLRTTASAVLALPGWEKSEIANDAVNYEKHYNKDIFYPKNPSVDDEELQKVTDWGNAPWERTEKRGDNLSIKKQK